MYRLFEEMTGNSSAEKATLTWPPTRERQRDSIKTDKQRETQIQSSVRLDFLCFQSLAVSE